MNEVLVIFSLAAAGCLVRLSTDLVLQLLARREASGMTVTGPDHGSPAAEPKADPVVTFALTLTCYGVIALAVVSELPGELPFQRTWLAFALMCVGGLVGEISRTGSNAAALDGDGDAQETEPVERTPASVGLSVALMLALNLAIAVLVSGQGLVQVVPPRAPAAGQTTELDPIVVVAKRGVDDAAGAASFL